MPNMIVYQPSGAKQPYFVFGDIFRFLVTGEETGGSYTMMEILVSPGDFVHIPRGTPHGFKNGPMSAKLIATFAPAGAEKLFQEVDEPVHDYAALVPPVTAEHIAHTMVDESKEAPETVLPSEPKVAEDKLR